MKHIRLSWVFVLSAQFISCNVMNSDNDLLPIDGNILFSILYDDTNTWLNQPGYVIILKTEKIYPCFNYKVISRVSVNSAWITVQLLGIDTKEKCAASEGPATAYIPLQISERNYKLAIDYMADKDVYAVSFMEPIVAVKKIENSFTSYDYIGIKFKD